MHLTPREIDKLMVLSLAEVAQRRREKGLKLNVDAWTGDEHGRAVKIERALALGFKNAKL